MEHLKTKHYPPEKGKYACLRVPGKNRLKTESHTNAHNAWVLEKFTV